VKVVLGQKLVTWRHLRPPPKESVFVLDLVQAVQPGVFRADVQNHQVFELVGVPYPVLQRSIETWLA
jgi:hypothetical protein